MANSWNELAGELRSALAARDWRQAGAIIWQLRQLDGKRFTLELEHYTNEQVRKGGYGMALEREQRLEVVRQWARHVLQDETTSAAWRERMNLAVSGAMRPGGAGRWPITVAWNHKNQLRDDMNDVIWSVLVELDMIDDEVARSSFGFGVSNA